MLLFRSLKVMFLWLAGSLALTVGVLFLFTWLHAPQWLWPVYMLGVGTAGIYLVVRTVWRTR